MSTFESVYDPETCVHASELRAQGMDIPDHIPDVAWVPRNSMVPTGDFNTRQDENDDKLFHFSMGIVFTQPFRWIEGKYVVQTQCSQCGSSEEKVTPDADAYDFYCDKCGLKLARGESDDDGER